jgi:hypothetical protein
MFVYIDNFTISVAFYKRDVASLLSRAVINMTMPAGIMMLMTGKFLMKKSNLELI